MTNPIEKLPYYRNACEQLAWIGFTVELLSNTNGHWTLRWTRRHERWECSTAEQPPHCFSLLGFSALKWLDAREFGTDNVERWAQEVRDRS